MAVMQCAHLPYWPLYQRHDEGIEHGIG